MRFLTLSAIVFCSVTGCHVVGPDPDFMAKCFDYRSDRECDAPEGAAGPTGWQELPNPILVPPVEREYLWSQLVDTIDDYFDIDTEQRMVNLGGVLSEGQIETHYVAGATWLEPWRWDSASLYERTLATFQSVRRRASVRVKPEAQRFAVQVVVEKELEDVSLPLQQTPGSVVPRQDGTLARLGTATRLDDRNLGWIPLGRDFELEQEILSQLNARLVEGGTRP